MTMPLHTMSDLEIELIESGLTKLSQACHFGPLSQRDVIERVIDILVERGLAARTSASEEDTQKRLKIDPEYRQKMIDFLAETDDCPSWIKTAHSPKGADTQREAEGRSRPETLAIIEAAERLRAGMKGHYVHAEDLYCFDEALSQYRSGK